MAIYNQFAYLCNIIIIHSLKIKSIYHAKKSNLLFYRNALRFFV